VGWGIAPSHILVWAQLRRAVSHRQANRAGRREITYQSTYLSQRPVVQGCRVHEAVGWFSQRANIRGPGARTAMGESQAAPCECELKAFFHQVVTFLRLFGAATIRCWRCPPPYVLQFHCVLSVSESPGKGAAEAHEACAKLEIVRSLILVLLDALSRSVDTFGPTCAVGAAFSRLTPISLHTCVPDHDDHASLHIDGRGGTAGDTAALWMISGDRPCVSCTFRAQADIVTYMRP
jgi:hypothetical protein